MIAVPVSVGELVDKVTILRLKSGRVAGMARNNVIEELTQLEVQLASVKVPQSMIDKLGRINSELWEIEDDKRRCMERHDYGAAFRALSRSVAQLNDARASVKRAINELTGSVIREEKVYARY